MRRWIGVCLVLALGGGAPAVHAAGLSLRWSDGRTVPALPLQRLADDSDELYFSADALAAALHLERFWKPETRKLVLKVGERRIQVTVDTRVVLDGDEEMLLRVPVLYRDSSVMLPLEFLDRVLAPALGNGAHLDRKMPEFALGSGDADVSSIDYLPTASGTEIRLRLARALRTRVQATSDELVRVQLAGGKVDPVALAADQPAPLVRNVRAEQGDKEATVYFQVDPTLAGVQDRSEDGGRTLVIALQRGQTHPVPQAPAFVQPLVEVPSAEAGKDSFDIVVLDPGHGGFERGVQANDRVEKDVTLQLAQQIQPLLEHDLGVRVLLTRSGDETISPESRAEIANRVRADVFISLHCNGWYDAKASGFEVLYASADRSTAGDQALVAASHGFSDFSPWNTAHLASTDRSAALANCIQSQLAQQLDVANRGTRAADVEVLEGTTMPAVLLEIGFLTNPDEAAKLTGAEFPARLAASLSAALQQFRRQDTHAAADSAAVAPRTKHD